MKFSLKHVFVVGALAAASAPAFADVALPQTNNSDLLLFVYDATQSISYVKDLGVSMNSIISQSQVVNGTYANGSNVGSSLLQGLNGLNVSSDANYVAFKSHTGADALSFAVVGGAFDTTQSDMANLGASRYVTTTGATLTAGTAMTNDNLSGTYNAIDTTISGNVNPYLQGTATTAGFGADGGAANLIDWFGAGAGKTAQQSNLALGSTANLYFLASSGTTKYNGNFYNLGTMSLSSAGILTVTTPAAVPVPAAFWLLGSGLAGLVGIGRRKAA